MSVLGKTKQDVVSQFRCAEIIAAARKVFGDKGFNEATVDEIAEAAGLAKGTVYLYFASKRDVYLAALRDGISRLIEESRQNVAAAGDLRDKIRAFIGTRLRHAEQDRDFFKIYLSEFGNVTHPASINEEFRELYRNQLSELENLLEAAHQSGQIRPVSVETTASALYEMTRGLVVRRVLGWSRGTVEEDIDQLCDLMWMGLRR